MKTSSSTPAPKQHSQSFKLNAQLSFGEVAYQSIQKHFKKSTKYEKGVLADQDPENLHQMRVGMRRLRTAIDVFAPAIQLPQASQRPQVTKISKRLGKVRDLDVLHLWFQHYLQSSSAKATEAEPMQQVLLRLDKQRSKQFTQLPKMFKGKGYCQFVCAYEDWLADPQFSPVAKMPILDVLPDLLLPLLSQLFLHPGWLVATETIEGRPYPIVGMNPESLDDIFATSGLDLHDLRKQMKRVRYQTEFFIPFFGKSYQVQARSFRDLQELLGLFQDQEVLSDFLATALEPNWPEQLPSLATLLAEERFRNWKQWQTLQLKYLDPKFRRTLSRRVLSPALELTS
ncbi:MAG: CHAD domain-containing protein [Acaryochloris sp. RU_4_1]|nr:CHAD domain-containing protein [Acaryochloris sp. RU_4_1]NJR56179.1 CHAD domain-containing protein [Acaryochloris sp. CRU_2_0]